MLALFVLVLIAADEGLLLLCGKESLLSPILKPIVGSVEHAETPVGVFPDELLPVLLLKYRPLLHMENTTCSGISIDFPPYNARFSHSNPVELSEFLSIADNKPLKGKNIHLDILLDDTEIVFAEGNHFKC